MATTTTILETEPSAVELMGRMLIELTRQQPGYARQIAYQGRPGAVLAVEYYGESEEELQRPSSTRWNGICANRADADDRSAARLDAQATGRMSGPCARPDSGC